MASYKVIICSHCGKKLKYTGKNKPTKCSCNNPYWDKPEYEYKLFMLQKNYIDSNYNIIFLREMYPILNLYATKLLLKKIKGKFFLTHEQVEEKVFDTIHKIYEYYLRDKGYKITDSFAGCINFIFLNVLHNRKERKKNDTHSLNLELDDKGNELLTNIVGLGFLDLEDEKNLVEEQYFRESKEITNKLIELLESLINKTRDKYGHITAYKVICGVNHLLNNRTDIFMDKYFDLVGRKVKNIVQWFFTKIYDFLYEYKTIDNINEYINRKLNEIDNFRV